MQTHGIGANCLWNFAVEEIDVMIKESLNAGSWFR